MIIRPKDFLETEEGLVFAVVDHQIENDRAMAFLRYVPSSSDRSWDKLNTQEANSFLQQNFPGYLYHSIRFDADLHGVHLNKIKKIYSTKQSLQQLLHQSSLNIQQQKLSKLAKLFITHKIPADQLGITGSFLIGAQNPKSDMDFVVHDRDIFHQLRRLIKHLIYQDEIQVLQASDWEEAYARRGCSLSLDEYIWHEQRKFNKAIFQDVKFDISLVAEPPDFGHSNYTKKGEVKFVTEITADMYAFDTPARYQLSHSLIEELICATPTYSGQAFIGETVKISGVLEESEAGCQRVIVGTSREAYGEYVRVCVTE